ncbi:negative regulator of systemic acquired resistance SNI1 isoform X2 [Hevea brasiliensis]|uniref:negative regulator of systemic acquired resistance SNI1 isoform X2 n=1 Tax=Hevea brasiliensis TaxID=3981 RepID=UPI0025F0F2C0|nr:negative regulator of systemic acquired resistance SNI1 isoform X2 [Hevea brasiliensis]
MEDSINGRRCGSARGGIEENVLAILDATDSKDTQDANDDRIAFIEAVRAASIDRDDGAPPTNKMYEAVFQIMRGGKSLELIMESFRLLNELDERFPRAYLSNTGASGSSELAVVEEAWSPFVFNLDITYGEKESAGKSSGGTFDSSVFHLLIQDLVEIVNEKGLQTLEIRSLGKMLLFQYLVNVLEGDLVPRNKAYKETMNWMLLRESLLSMLLSSRRVNYKSLMKDCLSIMCGLCQFSSELSGPKPSDSSVANPSQNVNPAIAIAIPEVRSSTCTAIQKLLTIIMELDVSRKKADAQGCTTRVDGVRTPLVEIILDELTYDRDMLSQFLEPSVRTRRSNGPTEDDGTFTGVLKGFSNITSTKNITKKISIDVVQILLAHAFQAYLSIPPSQQEAEGIFDSKDKVRSDSLVEICENVISAFSNLKRINE